MLNKTIIALAATVVLGSASAAFAYEAPENKIGDRYPFLEQVYQPVSANRLGSRNMVPRQVAYVDQYSNEAPENKIGDRYPSLERVYQPVSTDNFAGRYLATRMAARADSSYYTNEAPENKISDRYPFLERVYVAQAEHRIIRTTMARMHHKKNMKM